MLNNEASAASVILLQGPIAASNTAGASSSWIDIRNYIGEILVVQQTGNIAGSYTGALEHATDSAGTGAASVTFNEGALPTINAASGNMLHKRTVAADSLGGWVRNRGTIVTGPAYISITLAGRPKNV